MTASSKPQRSEGVRASSPKQRVNAVKQLLDADPFARIRSESELSALVRAKIQTSERPYAELTHGLMGVDPDIDEALAKRLWVTAIEHKRALRAALGRDVLLRVALLDLLSTSPNLGHVRPPVVLSRRLLGRVLRETTTDPLTGLMRREEFVAVMAHELRQRSKIPPILAYIDLDNFKAVNDTRGHTAGDRVLQTLGRILLATGRESDAFARLGGDEFGSLFIECGLTHAREALARLRTAFLQATEGLGVDLAIGLVVARTGESPATLIERADRAMYVAKNRRKRASPTPRARLKSVTALALVRDPDALFALHRQLARLGCITVPATDVASASSLFGLLQPTVVCVADITEAQRWLAELAAKHPAVRCVRLIAEGAPEQRSLRGELIVRQPLTGTASARLLRMAVGRAGLPIAELRGPRDARRLSQTIEKLLSGELTPTGARRAGARPETDLVSGLLGG